MTPYLVSHYGVDAIFPRVAGYLQKAIEHNRCSGWTTAALYQACSRREAFLFVDDIENPKNAMTLRFETWGGEPVCYIMFLGGEGGCDWVAAMPHIRKFAEALGAKRVCANLRDGWLRKFKAKRLASLCEIEE